MRSILISLTLLALLTLTGCQASLPLSIVPSTMTPTPTGQPDTVATPTDSAAATATTAITATAVITQTTLPPTPTASATPLPSSTPTATPAPTDTATATAAATLPPTATATTQPTETATTAATRPSTAKATATPTALLQSRRLTPTVTRLPFTATPTRTRPLPTSTRRLPTRTPTPARLRIEMTETQLNKLVRDAIAKDPNTPVRSISIDTKAGKVVITAVARLGFFNVNLEITVVVDVRNGRATPVIQEILVNGRPAAGILRQQVEAALQPYLNQIADISKEMYVESVKISESGLTIDGRPK